MGLANPGPAFAHTRHNVGGAAVYELASRLGLTLSLERRQRAALATTEVTIGRVTLAVPITFMNEAGSALPPLLQRTSIENIEHLLVAHDELDLDPGRLQLKEGGGLAGHNGLRSVSAVLGSKEFRRLRIGIGKPPSKEHGADWVTQPLSGSRRRDLEATVDRAADVLERLCEVGFEQAQRETNGARD